MPDINLLGQITGGRQRNWLNDSEVAFDPNASMLVARNGRKLACIVGRGVYNDAGPITPPDTMLVGDMNAAHGAVGQDGTIGLWLHYPDGGDVQLVAMNGAVTDIPGAFPQGNGQFCIYDSGRAVWVDGRGILRAFGLSTPLTLPGTLHNLNVFQVDGKFWILYHANAIERIVCHPFDELRGYSFDPGFYPRVRQGTARGVVVAIAADPADTPGRDFVLDVSAPRVDLLTLLDKEPPPVTEKPWPEYPLLPERVWTIVQEEFAAYTENLWGSTCKDAGDPACPLGPVLNRIVWRANGNKAEGPWGLNRKEQGYHVSSPVGNIASDILHHRDYGLWDVFGSNWAPVRGSRDEHPLDSARPWVAAVNPGGLTDGGGGDGGDPGDETDPPKDPRLAGVIDALRKLEPAAQQSCDCGPKLAALEARIVAMEHDRLSSAVVSLKSHHGKYASVQPDGSVVFDRDSPGPWEEIGMEVR